MINKIKEKKIKNKYFNETANQKNLHLHEFDDTVPMHMNWNRCLSYIKSKYFKFLFSDDLLSPEFCFECVKVLEDRPAVDLIATDLNYFEDNKALFEKNETPTEEQILDAMGGVLCRCTGYHNIVMAVLAVGGTA